MFRFFEALSSIFSTIVNFVSGIFEMLGNLLAMIFKGTAFLFALVPNLPPYCMSFFSAILGVAILIQIINKGG